MEHRLRVARYALFMASWIAAAAAADSQAAGVQVRTEMIPMRDGVRLAADIRFPSGNGPWPAVVSRTPYNRKQQPGQAVPFVSNGYVFVSQDWRGLGDSEGQFTPGLMSGTPNPDDGYDTVEWIARQSWCDGKVGIIGSSAPGIAAKLAMLSNPPHLAAAYTTVCAMFPQDYNVLPQDCAFYHGGVSQAVKEGQGDRWAARWGLKLEEWPKPHVTQFHAGPLAWPVEHKEAVRASRIPLMDHGGWFDIFAPSALDDFNAVNGPHNRVIVAARGHGAQLGGLNFPSQTSPDASALAWFDYWLQGKDTGVLKTAPIRYFLMGDARGGGGPGNIWKHVERWPVPHTPVSWYLWPDGRLRNTKPTAETGSLAYVYDPRDPLPTVGGANLGENRGPLDQRKLKDRRDILRVTSDPLEKPLTITGKVLVDLFVSADVSDTTVMAKLIDIYPDGYEALMLDNAIMARYANGFDKPAPVENGKIYRLTIDLWNIALVFAPGHRIALHVAGSNTPRYDVHPNSYRPVNSYDGTPIAHVSVHASASCPSRLILPVVEEGGSSQ
jgi:predicted acyl esterase